MRVFEGETWASMFFTNSSGDVNVHSKLQTRTAGFTIRQALLQVLGKEPQSSLLKELSVTSNV